jgi:nucleoside permease NupC
MNVGLYERIWMWAAAAIIAVFIGVIAERVGTGQQGVLAIMFAGTLANFVTATIAGFLL